MPEHTPPPRPRACPFGVATFQSEGRRSSPFAKENSPEDLSSTPSPESFRPSEAAAALALRVVLAQSLSHSLSLGDIAALTRTCRVLRDPGERALVRGISVAPPSPIVEDASCWDAGEDAWMGEGWVSLRTASAVESFERFVGRWITAGTDGTEGTERELLDSEPPTPGIPSTAANGTPTLHLRRLALDLWPLEFSSPPLFVSIQSILSSCTSTLTHLHIAYTEPLLASSPRDPDPDQTPSLSRALLGLPLLTSLSLSVVGPLGCALLKNLTVHLQDVQVDFDDAWVQSVVYASSHTGPNAGVPTLQNGDLSGLPTSMSATSPGTDAVLLPDPVSLLAHSMASLRTLRASNAIIVTVTDKLRYPAVRRIALRLAGVPTITPLVHAFPGVADVYVYTPFDGCGVRLPPPPPTSPPPISPSTTITTATLTSHSMDAKHDDRKAKAAAEVGAAVGIEGADSPPGSPSQRKRRLRPSMPDIHATRDANRTSQLYSSFPPLACVRGFVPGLYALGLTCAVRHLEIGALSPPSAGWGGEEEVCAVREVLADTMPSGVTLGLERGWWAVSRHERLKAKAKANDKDNSKDKGRGERKSKRRSRERLRAIFTGHGNTRENTAWVGVSDLVIRVEEPGRWKDVTCDLLAMLLPLANTLTTLVLLWDRTSVPFDRIPHGEEWEYEGNDVAEAPAHQDHTNLNTNAGGPQRQRVARSSRTEQFARHVADQMPSLRYIFLEILHDRPPPSLPPSSPSSEQAELLASAPIDTRLRRRERLFWRIDRSEGWLCLDSVPEAAMRKVMNAAGLSFDDRVRYAV